MRLCDLLSPTTASWSQRSEPRYRRLQKLLLLSRSASTGLPIISTSSPTDVKKIEQNRPARNPITCNTATGVFFPRNASCLKEAHYKHFQCRYQNPIGLRVTRNTGLVSLLMFSNRVARTAGDDAIEFPVCTRRRAFQLRNVVDSQVAAPIRMTAAF